MSDQPGARLARFVEAQDLGDTYETALAELRTGVKRSHWMWFVFPQLAGLGRSPTAQHYAIESIDQARDYLAHPVLGPRLRECSATLLALPQDDAVAVFGRIDAVKLRSSMTLFLRASGEQVFADVLAKFSGGEPDERTDRLLAHAG